MILTKFLSILDMSGVKFTKSQVSVERLMVSSHEAL